jgi:hypothetical protein
MMPKHAHSVRLGGLVPCSRVVYPKRMNRHASHFSTLGWGNTDLISYENVCSGSWPAACVRIDPSHYSLLSSLFSFLTISLAKTSHRITNTPATKAWNIHIIISGIIADPWVVGNGDNVLVVLRPMGRSTE